MSFLWVSSLRLLCCCQSPPSLTQEPGIRDASPVVANTACMSLCCFTTSTVSCLLIYIHRLMYHNLSVDANVDVFCGFLNEDVRKFQSNNLFLRTQQFRLFAQRMLENRYLPPSPAPPLWHPFIPALFIVAIHFVPSLLFLRSLSDTS